MRSIRSLALTLSCVVAAGGAAMADTKDDVLKRGTLLCSAHTSSYFGFAELTDKGEWKGFDIDFCKALATTVFGDPSKVTYVAVDWAQRFPALQSGELDVVFKNTTWTQSRDAELGFQFSLPYQTNSVQIAVPAAMGITSATELGGATACGLKGSSTELVLAGYFSQLGAEYKSITYDSNEEMMASYDAGRCDYLAAVSLTLAMAKNSLKTETTILPELLNLNVNGAVVRQNDDHWLDLVNWTISATIIAEELGITSENVDSLAEAKDNSIAVDRFLGNLPGIGSRLGLRETWAREVVKNVGNYGEIFERNLGAKSAYNLERGKNQSWRTGGLLITPSLE